MDEQKAQGAAPGWYPANDMPGAVRYWDGERWTDHVAPMQPQFQGPSTTTIARGVALGVAAVIAGLFFLNSCHQAEREREYVDCLTSDSPRYCEKP